MSNKNKPKRIIAGIRAPAVDTTLEAAKARLGADQKDDATKYLDEVEAAVEAPEAVVEARPVSHNPSLLVWPTDIWGLTKDLKEAMIRTASRVGGHKDKMELVQKTLDIGVQHLAARFHDEQERRRIRGEV